MEITEKIDKLINQNNRKIIFYFDEDGSFIEELPAIEDSGIRVVEVQQNFFELKYLLEFEWTGDKVFLYHPYARPAGKYLRKYPLLDLLKANIELRLDDASEFLAEYRLQEHHLPLVNRYIRLLKSKSNQKKLARILDRTNFNEDNLKEGLISISLDFHTVVNRNLCVAKWIVISMDNKNFEKINNTIISLDLENDLLKWINGLLNMNGKDLNRELAVEVACKIKYNIIAAPIANPDTNDNYAKLKIDQAIGINRLQAFFNDWANHPSLKDHIEPVFDNLASDIRSDNILEWYGANQEFGYYTPRMLNSIILGLYEQALINPVRTRENCLKWLRTSLLSGDNHHQISFISHASYVHGLLDSYSSFKFNKPEDFIKQYTGELYNIDLHFRKAVISFDKVRDRLYEFEEASTGLFNTLNQKYDRFLIEFNVEWQKVLNEIEFNYQKIPIVKQFDFYKKYLEEFEYKIVVIISDALRYELGHELYNDLVADSKNSVSIDPCLASIPSYTNLGMANLLPNSGISVEKGEPDLVFKINDTKTFSSKRGATLKMAEEESNTINFSEVMKWDRDQGRDFFRNNRLVYIYHDWIDAIGDKRRTEYETFEATAKATGDINRMIKKLNAWNVYHVMVTSDHGFLFNYTPLTESSRENLPKTKGYCRDHVRFVVSEDFEGKVDGYLMPMKNTTSIETDLKVAVPRAINRYRIQGNVGVQFVHGGASMQELLIPVIKLYRQKKEFGQSVTFKRIDENKKIASGSLKVIILQDQPVSNEYNNLEIVMGLYSDAGELLSNELTVNLNSTSTNPKERIFEPILTLTAKGSKANYCYLKAFEKSDKNRLNPIGLNDLIQISSLMEKDSWG